MPRKIAHQKPAIKCAEVDNELGRRRQRHSQANEHVGKDWNHELEEPADDQHSDRDHRDRINKSRLDGLAQPETLFNVNRQALENGVKDAAGFARFDHVVGQVVENFRIAAHGIGKGRATLDGRAHAGQAFPESLIFLIRAQNLQALHQRQAGIDHDRKLAKEDGQFGGLYLAAAGAEELATVFFADLRALNALFAESGTQHLLVFRCALAPNRLARCIFAFIRKNRHRLLLTKISKPCYRRMALPAGVLLVAEGPR